MSQDELKKTIDAVRSVGAEHAASREKALAFLVKMGVAKPSGELTEQYKKSA